MFSTQAFADLTTSQTQQYLIIATGSGHAFQSNGGEYGADQEVLSDSSKQPDGEYDSHDPQVDLKGESKIASSWVAPADVDDRGISQYLPGAKILKEVPDYTGNVAITDGSGDFQSENSDYFASIGIRCNRSASSCNASADKDNSWKENDAAGFDNFKELHHNDNVNQGGITRFDAGEVEKITDGLGLSKANLETTAFEDLGELASWKKYINSLDAEYKITQKDIDLGSGGIYELDIDKIDDGTATGDSYGEDIGFGNNDGIAVIDIDIGSDHFLFQNGNWILQTTGATTAIFRMKGTGSVAFNNASVMMGCSDKTNTGRCLDNEGNEEYVTDLGAMFYTDKAASDAFTLNNVVLGGIGLWDLTDGGNGINISSKIQGCTQLVSHTVKISSSGRLNRCSLAYEEPTTEVPEPSTLLLFSSMLLMLARIRNKKAA